MWNMAAADVVANAAPNARRSSVVGAVSSNPVSTGMSLLAIVPTW